MDKGKIKSVNKVRRFKDKLKAKMKVDRVLLFGSRAKGTARKDSDYDVIVVSPDFEGIHRFDRGIGFSRMWDYRGCPGGVDFKCYTPEEYNWAKGRITFLNAVLEYAIEV